MKLHNNVEELLKKWSKEYKKGFTSYLVLLLLTKKPMYGYEIKQEIDEVIGSNFAIQESGIYQILKKLRKKDFVEFETMKSEKGPKRKYYKITVSGRQMVKIFTKQNILPINNAVNKLIEKNLKI